MRVPLRVLLIEDSKDDADLLLHALKSTGYDVTHTRAQSREETIRALEKGGWDLVISDYVLPGFSGLDALKLLHESDVDLPFIIVSGKIGEEVAVEALKAGADDYLLKDRLMRLGPAIERALKEVSQKRKRRQAEAALRESEERYRRLVESCPDAMFILSEGSFVYVNPAAVKLLEARSPVELVGKSLIDFVDLSYRDLVEEHLRQALEGMDGPLLEHKIQSIAGKPILVEGIARAVSYHGEPAVQILCRDISTRKSLEQQLVNSQKMDAIGRLAGGVANDFNSLLTVITGYAGLIRSGLSPDHPLQADVEQITSSADRAILLTNQLLALSRKEALSTQPISLNTLVEQNVPLIKRLLGDKIACELRLDGSLNQIRADRGQMETVLLNLTTHARDSMPNGGRLVIETSNYRAININQSAPELKTGDFVVLSISDNGMGIADDLRDRVFEPFVSTTDLSRNTGLALATVYAIVKQHNGHIWCTSEIGKGSTFKIYLPRITTPKALPKPQKQAPVDCRDSGTILVVEDEEVLRDFSQLILRKQGYVVLSARNGEEALRIVEGFEKPLDLVFTDVVMPLMGGAELARKVIELKPKLPILFTSGYPRTVLNDYGLTDDHLEFLQKPYTTDALLEKVREMVNKSETKKL